MTSRTLGWVQDPAKIENLRKTVEVFNHESPTYRELIESRIRELIERRDGRDRFLSELSHVPLKLRYSDLVGKAFKPRSESRCNGILQAAIEGQRREFILNWPADNLLRWASAIGFIQYDRSEDCFSISELGLQFIDTQPRSSDAVKILSQALLSHPPVLRVLNLLADGLHLTKFEIGRQLGFVGEAGFTSLPQDKLVSSLAQTQDSKERNKLLIDWDGTSDKYARTIASWLKFMGWVRQSKKIVIATLGDKTFKYGISQAYLITNEGLRARERGLATNLRHRIPKIVPWEMMATKGRGRDLIRTRRTLILAAIAGNSCSLQALRKQLAKNGFNASETTITEDLQGLEQIGLNIQQDQGGYFLRDTIRNFDDFGLPYLN